jgi:predicted ATP-dependent serine protease
MHAGKLVLDGFMDDVPDAKPGKPQVEPEPSKPAPAVALDEIDAAELLASEEETELDFLPLLGRDGYIVRGWSHVLSGYPRCGKTELLVPCCASWLQAGDTMLYFTEEPRSIWRYRLGILPGPWAGLQLVFALGANTLELLARIQGGTETVVVIDTVRNLGVLPRDENDNAAIAYALTPFVAAARKGRKTLILVHHDRKGGGDHGEAIAGGHAFLGAVDIALGITRDSVPNRRVVRCLARLIEADELLYERDTSGLMVGLGDAGKVRLQEVRRQVLQVVDERWTDTKELHERLDDPRPSQEQVRKALMAEAEAGNLQRDPPLSFKASGKKSRWRLPSNDLGPTQQNLQWSPP